MSGSATAYFEHYARVNDLTPEGRRRIWPDYDHQYSGVLPPERNARILDLGCGAGLLLEWLLAEKKYTSATGIDTDAGQVGFAKRLGLSAQLVEDSSAWLVQQAQFDLIIMSDVLEHVPSPDHIVLLSNIRRAILPGGSLFLRVPNANSSFAARYRYIDSTHKRSYSETSLVSDLTAAGFAKIEVSAERIGVSKSLRGLGRFALLKTFRIWRRLEAIAEFGRPGISLPLSLNLIAVCHKERS
jgi:SAM-dependent methyltransferase